MKFSNLSFWFIILYVVNNNYIVIILYYASQFFFLAIFNLYRIIFCYHYISGVSDYIWAKSVAYSTVT